MEILQTYSFQIVALGTVALSIVSAVVGCLNVYKNQSLIGDAIGHSTFAGIVLAYMLFMSRNPVILLSGAIFAGALSYLLIHYSNKNSIIDLGSNLAIYLSGFFGLGMVLKSYIQGNKEFAGASQAGLENYIFGQAAYLLESDIILIFIVLVICITIITIFFKELKILIFDKEYAKLIGIPTEILEILILFMTILVIGVGIKSVGAVLISSFLIMPCISANQWSNKFSHVLVISVFFGVISSFLGAFISSAYTGFSTGPSIIIFSAIFCFISFIFGKNSFLRKRGEK